MENNENQNSSLMSKERKIIFWVLWVLFLLATILASIGLVITE